jgi:hypothetical protein
VTPPKPSPVLCRHCHVEIVQRDDGTWGGKKNPLLTLCTALGNIQHAPADVPEGEAS